MFHIHKNLLGKDNIIYKAAIEGIITSMNVDFEEGLINVFTKEAFIAEAILCNLRLGGYIDIMMMKMVLRMNIGLRLSRNMQSNME